MTLTEIVESYAPYHRYAEFGEGFVAYGVSYDNPYADGVAAQAWDRGLEAAMRWARAQSAA